uniref:hypothetical protein n=1 Tax=Jiella pacifica TaxID=2696469 RepID=UPI001FE68946
RKRKGRSPSSNCSSVQCTDAETSISFADGSSWHHEPHNLRKSRETGTTSLYASRSSLRNAIVRANDRANRQDVPMMAWTRVDKIGRIRDVLFPNWQLEPVVAKR